MSLWNFLKRARLRSLKEGQVQTMRAEVHDSDAKDVAERWQDYGFAANLVDGQGLVIQVGGHAIVMRADRVAERPQLAAYEVALWHKDGHWVKMKAGGVVEVQATTVNINAATTAISGNVTVGGTLVATGNVTGAGKSLATHTHSGVQTGGGNTGAPT